MFRNHVEDPIIKNEGFNTVGAFIDSFINEDIWYPRVKEACKRFGITVPEKIKPISQGQNPVSYIIGNVSSIGRIMFIFENINMLLLIIRFCYVRFSGFLMP
jgi:hypothetical protein